MSDNNLIRTMVRGIYNLQKLRIQMGNRVTANFKSKLGLDPAGMSEKELAKQEKKVLDQLRASYKRITDGVVAKGVEVSDRLPTSKRFKGDSLISSYAELVLVNQYMSILRDEERQFYQLNNVLKDIPIYRDYLADVRGVGPAIAAVIISEIDITKAQYPSSLWMLAGLDSVLVGTYTDDHGKEHTVPAWKISVYYNETNENGGMLAEGKYPVTYKTVGRSRRDFCLVKKEYTTKEGGVALRDSITFNPFLKTKLISVLGTSFLRSGTSTVDGKKMGAAKRLELAKSEGYDGEVGEDSDEEIQNFLRAKGHEVIVEPSEFAIEYYNYKQRLDNDARHKDKTDGHKHNMAIRFMIKRFLVRLYNEWRAIEGLPVAPEYSEAKLGKVHRQAQPITA